MDGSAEFRQFLRDVLSSSLPDQLASGEARPVVAPRRRSRRARLTTIEDVLDFVVGQAGSVLLSQGEQLFLQDDHNTGSIAQRLRRVINEERTYLDPGLVNQVNAQTNTFLLTPFLFIILHHRAIVEMLAHEEMLLEKYMDAIALHVMIQRERLRSRAPESATRDQLRRELITGRNELTRQVCVLIDNTAGFFSTHQALIHQRLGALLDRRAEWTRRDAMSVSFEETPSAAEIAEYQRLMEVERLLEVMPSRRDDLREEQNELQAQRATVAREERDQLRQDLDTVADELRRINSQTRELREERSSLRRSLGPRRPAIRNFLQARESGRSQRSELRSRDEFLRAFNRRLENYTERELWSEDDDERWEIYRQLLDTLVKGGKGMGLELIIDGYLERYCEINGNRDFGIYEHWTGLTYPGHPENAVDMNAAAGVPIFAMATQRLDIPARLQGVLPAPLGPFFYQESRVGSRGTRATTDTQDVFAKIAYGLLAQRGRRRTGSGDIADVFRDHTSLTLAPPWLADPARRNFTGDGMARIIAGLAFRNLTVTPLGRSIDETRTDVLEELEALIAEELELPEGTIIFDRRYVRADSGRAGVGRLLVHLQRAPHRIGSHRVWRAMIAILSDPRHCSSAYPDGLCHRLWQLLQELRGAGATPSRAGQSVEVLHRYRPSTAVQPIVEIDVLVHYGHLRDVASGMLGGSTSITLGTRMGEVGMTGNAVNSHIHVEVKIKRGAEVLGTLLPHEFFPLTRSYRSRLRGGG